LESFTALSQKGFQTFLSSSVGLGSMKIMNKRDMKTVLYRMAFSDSTRELVEGRKVVKLHQPSPEQD